MAVKYVPREKSWIFDTPAEAAQFFRLMNAEGPVTKPVRVVALAPESSPLSGLGRRLIVRLLKQQGSVPGRQLADHLGVKPSELGNVVVAIARWGNHYGLTRRDIILKGRRRVGGGKSVRTLRLAPSFMKKVQKGTIKDLTVRAKSEQRDPRE
jgi:hypothetical protein